MYCYTSRFIIFAPRQINSIYQEPPLTIYLTIKYSAVEAIAKIVTYKQPRPFGTQIHYMSYRCVLRRAVARNIKQLIVIGPNAHYMV